MMVQYSPYLIPYLLSMFISIGVGIYAWQRRRAVGVIWFAVYTLAQAQWTFGYIFELATPTLQGKLFWDNFQWFGTMLAAPMLFLFTLQFTGRTIRYARRYFVVAAAVAVLLTVLAYTNEMHHLLHTSVSIIPAPPFDVLYYPFTTLDWICTLYYLLFSYSTVIVLIQRFIRAVDIYRPQLAIIMFGAFIPITINLLGILGIQLADQRDIAPLTFGISNLITVWGLFGYHLFNIVPIARDTIFESVQVGVIVVDKSNRIVDFNPTSRRLLGSESGIIGQSLNRFLPEWESFRRSNSGERGVFTIVRNRANHEVRCEVSVSPLIDKRGVAIGTLLLLQDVTEKFHAQSEIEARTVALEQANAELKVAWRAAKDSEKVKAEFLAHMSHELRTPLNAILNFAEFLKAGWLGPTTPKQDDALEKIGESGLHLLSLINDVLDITKIEAGMMKLRIEPVNDMLEFLAPTIATMQTMLAAKDVVFETDIDPKLPTLYVDKRRLTQVLLNLLSNAAKFTEKGSVTFSVKSQTHDNRQEMLFVVADTGPGIDREDQASIFEPFKQSEYGIEKGGGTGLGIPISAGIVAAHHGRLWLESESGQGCIFYVAVPLMQPDESLS